MAASCNIEKRHQRIFSYNMYHQYLVSISYQYQLWQLSYQQYRIGINSLGSISAAAYVSISWLARNNWQLSAAAFLANGISISNNVVAAAAFCGGEA